MSQEEMIVYDVEEAAAAVAEKTGQELLAVEEVLEGEFMSNAALGFYEIPDDEEGQEFMEEVRKMRQEPNALIPPRDEPIEDYDEIEDRLVAFIGRVTEIEEANIEQILDEHILYLESKGILEPVDDD